jgi:hypothetical protein
MKPRPLSVQGNDGSDVAQDRLSGFGPRPDQRIHNVEERELECLSRRYHKKRNGALVVHSECCSASLGSHQVVEDLDHRTVDSTDQQPLAASILAQPAAPKLYPRSTYPFPCIDSHQEQRT